MAKNGARVPQYLSQPIMVLWFDIDEVLVFLLGLSMAVMFGGIWWILSIAATWGYIKIKKNYPKGLLKHMFYAIGVLKFDSYPIYQEKHHIE